MEDRKIDGEHNDRQTKRQAKLNNYGLTVSLFQFSSSSSSSRFIHQNLKYKYFYNEYWIGQKTVENKTDLQALYLSGTRPVSDPLAVLHLENQL